MKFIIFYGAWGDRDYCEVVDVACYEHAVDYAYEEARQLGESELTAEALGLEEDCDDEELHDAIECQIMYSAVEFDQKTWELYR